MGGGDLIVQFSEYNFKRLEFILKWVKLFAKRLSTFWQSFLIGLILLASTDGLSLWESFRRPSSPLPLEQILSRKLDDFAQ